MDRERRMLTVLQRAALMRRAERVFDMVLSDCRQRGSFIPEKIHRHQQVHIPGQFPPWVFKNTGQFYVYVILSKIHPAR